MISQKIRKTAKYYSQLKTILLARTLMNYTKRCILYIFFEIHKFLEKTVLCYFNKYSN